MRNDICSCTTILQQLLGQLSLSYSHCVLTLSIVFVSKEEEKKVVPKMVVKISFVYVMFRPQYQFQITLLNVCNLGPILLNVIYDLILQVQIDSDH